ncbi:MAG: ABC transporter permease, partial [Mesorhizobium sp.]
MQAQSIGASTIILEVLWRFWPVWVALFIVMGASFLYRKKLALYGQLFD